MSDHVATIEWERGDVDFTSETYPRDHTWAFEGGAVVRASAAPNYRGNPDLVDPEETFVAALSSCHMLTFLAIAANKGFVVERYTDRAVGILARNEAGRQAITHVALHPRIDFGGDRTPSDDDLRAMHDKAHHACFIANSVTTEVTVEAPQPAV